MSHLDDWAAALVDSELTSDERDGALAHLAGCLDCRVVVDDQRRAKAALASAAAAPAQPSADLTARLLAIPTGEHESDSRDVVRRAGAATPAVRPRGSRPWPSRGVRPVPARRSNLRRRALSGISVIGAALAVAVIAGGEAPGQVAPPVGTYVVEHTATTTRLPLQDQVANVVLISHR
ncbi:MAG TPA: hypothetical protein VNB94_02215 [Mycobacteriales bacterium]|nr:hypothetical protein [Mycobacteriales bacterium]